jgi:hypothetical protein
MPGRAAVRIELEEAERAELEARARRRKGFRADAMRAEIVLLAARRHSGLDRTLLPASRHPPSSLCIGTSESGH